MKRLLAYLKPHKWVMTAATVLVLFIIVVELYRPIVIGDAIDDYINGYYAVSYTHLAICSCRWLISFLRMEATTSDAAWNSSVIPSVPATPFKA